MEDKKITNCNQYPNHCPADALQCGRGRHYFEQLENPGAVEASTGESRNHRHGKSDDLYGLMRACGHYLHHSVGRHQEEREENLFAALGGAEQETLKGLLKKLLDSWEQ